VTLLVGQQEGHLTCKSSVAPIAESYFWGPASLTWSKPWKNEPVKQKWRACMCVSDWMVSQDYVSLSEAGFVTCVAYSANASRLFILQFSGEFRASFTSAVKQHWWSLCCSGLTDHQTVIIRVLYYNYDWQYSAIYSVAYWAHGAFVRSDTSSAPGADNTAHVEVPTASADTKPDDDVHCSVQATSELCQSSLISPDVDQHQSTIGWFLLLDSHMSVIV